MTDRQTWLDSLKVGDDVAISTRHGYVLVKIEKITPKRTFRLSRGYSCSSDGYSSPSVGAFNNYHMCEITPSILTTIEKNRLIVKLSKVQFNELDYDTLKSIDIVIKQAKLASSEEML